MLHETIPLQVVVIVCKMNLTVKPELESQAVSIFAYSFLTRALELLVFPTDCKTRKLQPFHILYMHRYIYKWCRDSSQTAGIQSF